MCFNRITTLQARKDRVGNAVAQQGGGFRLEVTVQAPTLQDAQRLAEASRLLDPTFLFSHQAGDQQLRTHTVKKEEMLADLESLLKVVEKKRIMTGASATKSNQVQRQVVVDLYNALGWNPGRRPTPLDSPSAWWKSNREALQLSHQLERFTSVASCRRLFWHIQLLLPCHHCHRVGTYHATGGATKFQLRCTQHCGKTLSRHRFRQYIDTLAASGRLGIDLHALIAEPSKLHFVSPAEDQLKWVNVSTIPALRGLCRTKQMAEMRDSLLECLVLLLEGSLTDDVFVDPQYIQREALDWLQENTMAVVAHLGTQSRPAIEAFLEKLDTRHAVLELEEEIVLLHGVAGAFHVQIAHLLVRGRSWGCQIVPIDSRGPYLGLIKMPAGYEVLASK